MLDDCLMIAKASVREAQVVGEVLQNYCTMSGQKVNINKSHVIFGTGVAHLECIKIKKKLQMSQANCPIPYLGVNIGMKRLPLSAYNPMLERIRNKLSSWKARALSFSSKAILVQSVIQSIPVYLMSSGWVPKTLLDEIESYCTGFLWSKDGERCNLPLVSWEKMRKSRGDGGLGFRQLKPFHEALLEKQLAKFLTVPPSLWARVITR